MKSPRNQFLIAIRPISVGLQILGLLLFLVAWWLSSPEYHYDGSIFAAIAVMLSITIPLSLRLRLLVAVSIMNIWILSACFLMLTMPSPNRDFWAFSLAVTFALVIASLYQNSISYVISCSGSTLILGAGHIATPPVPGDTNWVILMTTSVLFIGCVLNGFFSRLHIRNIQLRNELEDLAYRDALTGIGNRRKLIRDINAASASRNMKDCCFLMIDIDGFKQINDQYGHDQGDMVLKQLGAMLARLLCADVVGRMGGEEFGALTLYGGQARASELARLILDQTRDIRVADRPVTVSIGIAWADATFTDMARNADDALYQAKRSGKDRFVFHRHSADAEVLAPVESLA